MLQQLARSLVHFVKMKLIYIYLCVVFTSQLVAQTLDDIDFSVLEIHHQVDANSQKLDQILKAKDSQKGNMLDRMDAMKGYVLGRIISVKNQMDNLEKILHGWKDEGNLEDLPCTCYDLKLKGITKSGVYKMLVHDSIIQVYCDMETDGGGWLVFQRRKDGSVDFKNRKWDVCKSGFGDLKGEFWLGNENLYQLLSTCGSKFETRFELGDFNNETRFAKYSSFNVASEDDFYKLTIAGYSGDAGDSLDTDTKFSSKDKDNDKSRYNCAAAFDGSWWHSTCYNSNLNGGYYPDGVPLVAGFGVKWNSWKGSDYSLKFTEMKFRPKK